MKYVILVPDGMADYPIEQLGNKTPLEVAKTPNMDWIVQNGILGRVDTIPKGMTPASDVANMSLLGYDPAKYYSGRGPLEAVNLGVDLDDDDIAFRCNLVTTSQDSMIDYSAGHISSKESKILLEYLDKELGSSDCRFYPGVSYRHLMVIKDGGRILDKVKCIAPHDILNKNFLKNYPRGKNSELIIDLMEKSKELLLAHEINKVRVDLKENPASMIWLWGQGKKPSMPSFKEKYNKTGAVISAVDLIKGLGRIIGLEVINVPGATGYYDSDIAAKARYALRALKNRDFVFVHVEATDEAGHNGDLRMKIASIERFDELVVGTFVDYFKKSKIKYRVLVIPDHATPISVRTHTSDTVCFAMAGQAIEHNGFDVFSEQKAIESKIYFPSGNSLIEYFFKE